MNHLLCRRTFVYLLLLLVGVLCPIQGSTEKEAKPKVLILKIEGAIERGVSAYVARALDEAEDEGAALVIMPVNTPGGRLDSALEIKDAIMNSSVPVVAWINRQALSAGALISIAANEIYMIEGAVIGAATPVLGSGQEASPKVVSAVRKIFAATAESRNRDPKVAEAMVDKSVTIPNLVDQGQLLTLTAGEAEKWGYTDGLVENMDEILAKKGLTDAQIIQTAPALAEMLVGFLTQPVVSSLLISLGFLGLLYELITAGWGVGGTIAVIFLGLFFWSHFLTGLAGWEGVALVVLGLLFIALEVFVIPGFGVSGILGLLFVLGGLFISLIGDFSVTTPADFLRAGYVLLGSLGIILVGTWAFIKFLPKTRSLGGLFLAARLDPTEESSQKSKQAKPQRKGPKIGAKGEALTDLRPSGTALLNGERADVVTEGQYVTAGTTVELIASDGYRLVVRPIEEAQTGKAQK